ncbi:MAG: DNA-directed RNA polymerase subunit alpha C-terminal domain-containing protein [Chloroflexota bacterium]
MKRLERRDNIREQVEQEREAANEVPVDLHISELDLNARFENILVEAGITSVGDVLAVLEEQGDDGILNLSGIGQQALLDIKKGLRRHGHDVPMTEA